MTTGSVNGSNGSIWPGKPAPVNVHVVPAASAFVKSAGDVMMPPTLSWNGTSTIAFVPTTWSAPNAGPAFVRMTEPIPVQVALNSNACGPTTGSADTPPATMSETAKAAAIVAMKRLIRHLPFEMPQTSVEYSTG